MMWNKSPQQEGKNTWTIFFMKEMEILPKLMNILTFFQGRNSMTVSKLIDLWVGHPALHMHWQRKGKAVFTKSICAMKELRLAPGSVTIGGDPSQ